MIDGPLSPSANNNRAQPVKSRVRVPDNDNYPGLTEEFLTGVRVKINDTDNYRAYPQAWVMAKSSPPQITIGPGGSWSRRQSKNH